METSLSHLGTSLPHNLKGMITNCACLDDNSYRHVFSDLSMSFLSLLISFERSKQSRCATIAVVNVYASMRCVQLCMCVSYVYCCKMPQRLMLLQA